MPRCESCGLFCGLENSDPEVLDYSWEDGVVTGEVRIVLTSECCGDEVKESIQEFEVEVDGLTGDWDVEIEAEPTDRYETTNRKGKPITNPRYQTHYWGAVLSVTATPPKEVECEECVGDGLVQCEECGGDGMVDCPECDGTGECNQCFPHPEPGCEECGGSGKCRECEGDGRVNCGECDGVGEVDCEECGGSGKVDNTEQEEITEEVTVEEAGSGFEELY